MKAAPPPKELHGVAIVLFHGDLPVPDQPHWAQVWTRAGDVLRVVRDLKTFARQYAETEGVNPQNLSICVDHATATPEAFTCDFESTDVVSLSLEAL
jgi:hypothetical protein